MDGFGRLVWFSMGVGSGWLDLRSWGGLEWFPRWELDQVGWIWEEGSWSGFLSGVELGWMDLGGWSGFLWMGGIRLDGLGAGVEWFPRGVGVVS